MELRRHITRMVRYNGWANARILDEVVKILPEQPTFGEKYGVLPDELLHIVHAEEHWLASWRHEKGHYTTDVSRAQLVAAFAKAQADLERFLAGLDEAALARSFTRVGTHETITAPLVDLIAHLVTHNTYHRGEIALLLTREGVSPGDIDLYDFILQGG